MARVHALWQYMTGYAAAGFRALVEQGHDVRIIHEGARTEPPYLAPFDDAALLEGIDTITWSGKPAKKLVLDDVESFAPDILLVNSWHVPAYMAAGRRMRGRALRLVVMDHQWLGRPKQWLGRMTRSVFLAPALDGAFLPGDPQAEFARRLGFPQHAIISGLYTCDHPFFTGPQTPPRDAFLFVGRLVDVKGIDVLAEAYRRYRVDAVDPWPLRLAGIGPMEDSFDGIDGVELLGFVEPDDLPGVMAEAGCLLLPSRFEPWGVVVHEAAASGMAVICTTACGAQSRLVLDGYNGRVIAVDDVGALADAMRWIAASGRAHREEVSQRSVELARQYDPSRWAEHLVERSLELLPRYTERRP